MTPVQAALDEWLAAMDEYRAIGGIYAHSAAAWTDASDKAFTAWDAFIRAGGHPVDAQLAVAAREREKQS